MKLGNFDMKLEAVSVVVIGSFNPAIFHPNWFATENLIRPEEEKDARIDVVHPEVTKFELPWLQFECTHERMLLASSDASSYVIVRDLASGIFKNLSHTPIIAFGLNSDMHFEIEDLEQWHALGHHFAPKADWEDIIDNPGMRSLVIEGKVPKSSATYIRIKLEPSVKIKPGVYCQVNFHFHLVDKETTLTRNAARLREELKLNWDTFIEYRTSSATHVMKDFRDEK